MKPIIPRLFDKGIEINPKTMYCNYCGSELKVMHDKKYCDMHEWTLEAVKTEGLKDMMIKSGQECIKCGMWYEVRICGTPNYSYMTIDCMGHTQKVENGIIIIDDKNQDNN